MKQTQKPSPPLDVVVTLLIPGVLDWTVKHRSFVLVTNSSSLPTILTTVGQWGSFMKHTYIITLHLEELSLRNWLYVQTSRSWTPGLEHPFQPLHYQNIYVSLGISRSAINHASESNVAKLGAPKWFYKESNRVLLRLSFPYRGQVKGFFLRVRRSSSFVPNTSVTFGLIMQTRATPLLYYYFAVTSK